jgi:hypothetical protein
MERHENARLPAIRRADLGSWSVVPAAREQMICVSHKLVGIDRQTPDSA